MASTIRDVARLAGVSKSTVSRVFNGSPGVSEATAARVLAAAKALRYHPNQVAQSLVKRRTRTLGLITPDQRNPFYAHASWVAEREARRRGYVVMVCNSDNSPPKEEEYLQVLDARQVDGILLIGGVKNLAGVIRYAAVSTTPMVLVDRHVGAGYPIPSVILDNVSGGREMTELLLRMGHRRIAFATSEYTMAERDRRLGYQQALEAAGIPIDPSLIVELEEAAWKEGCGDALVRLLTGPNPPTAIFASNDLKAIAIYRLVQRLGLQIPRDVSVVGYDDIDVADLVHPPLTTMAQPIDEMTTAGMELLLGLIRGEAPREEPICFRAQLRLRASAAPPGRATLTATPAGW